jgi:PAS domain S-box-containing protein
VLDFRLRLYIIGRNARWMVMAVAAATVWFGNEAARAHATFVTAMLVGATFYNLALYVIPWRQLEERGKGNWVVVPYLVADSICISIVVYATGQVHSNFFVSYALLIVWTAIYPGLRGKPWLWSIVLASYSVAVFWDTQPTVAMVVDFLVRTAIFSFVGYMANRIAWDLHRATVTLDDTVAHLTEGVVVLDESNRVVMINPRARELLGVSEAQAIGRRPDDPGLPTELEPLSRLIATEGEATADDGEVQTHEIVAGDNPERVVRVYSTPYVDQTEQTVGTLLVLQDITGDKRLERLRADFISALGHDLRNPLGTVRILADVIRHRWASKNGEESLKVCGALESETGRLIRLTDELLDYTRLEEGKLELDRAAVDLTACINHVARVAEWRASQHRHALTTEVARDLPEVYGDRDRLVRVIQNLVDNAMKYTPEGGSIRLWARRCPDRADFAQVSVADTGVGIPEQEIQSIFDRYARIKDETLPDRKGSGLGLAICKALVTAHGGSLWVESEHGKGSTFHFTIPFAGAQDQGAR